MMNWINKKRNKKGFTLIELVVVIAILGILAAIAIPRLTTSRKAAAVSAHNANVRTIEGAAAMFLADGVEDWVETGDGAIALLHPKYMNNIPVIPTGLKLDDGTKYVVTLVGTDKVITVKPGLYKLGDDGEPVLVSP